MQFSYSRDTLPCMGKVCEFINLCETFKPHHIIHQQRSYVLRSISSNDSNTTWDICLKGKIHMYTYVCITSICTADVNHLKSVNFYCSIS